MRAAAMLLLLAAPVFAQVPGDPDGWPQHSLDRPQPMIVDPGTGVPPEAPGRPPSDAVVLFDGRDLSAWKSQKDGSAAPWKVENGYFEVVPKSGGIETKQGFGDAQLHIEWMAPEPAAGSGQDRGNSGVFFGGGRYEVQVLDSFGNKTYPDGQAGALYGQFPPLVNASRAPGRWQAYDIVYEAPRFDGAGKVLKPARVTVFHNGVVVQHAMDLIGETTNRKRTQYSAHPEKLPVRLQDHGHRVRFRNVWLREIATRR